MIDDNQERSLALLMHRSRIGEALHYTEWATRHSPSVLGSECSPCLYQARYMLRNGVSISLGGDDWRSLAHAFRTYAQHSPGCAYQPTYPDGPEATCDCAFDVLLDRYDRLSAT